MVTIDGKPCVDPEQLRETCWLSKPPLSTQWYGEPNGYYNPIGLTPGYGKLLLCRKDLDDLLSRDPNKPRRLEFQCRSESGLLQKVILQNIRFCGHPLCLTPGRVRDADSVYLVDISDRRVDCEGLTNKRYNWRIAPTSSLHPDTLKNGASWSWEEIIRDLWNHVKELGDFPGLPPTPTNLPFDIPSQIDCHGFRAADALEDILALHGLAVSYNPVADTFSIIYLSQYDEPLRVADVTLRKAGLRIYDDDKHHGGMIESPEYVRVLFPIWTEEGDSADPRRVYAVDVKHQIDDIIQPRRGTFAVIQDYKPCRLNSAGTIQDSSGMLVRAYLAAQVYFDRLWRLNHGDPLNTVYSGYHTHPPFLRHNSIDCIGWVDYGHGPMTIVMRAGRQGINPLYTYGTNSPLTYGSILSDITSFTPVRSPNEGWVRGGGLPPTPLESRLDRMGERP